MGFIGGYTKNGESFLPCYQDSAFLPQAIRPASSPPVSAGLASRGTLCEGCHRARQPEDGAW